MSSQTIPQLCCFIISNAHLCGSSNNPFLFSFTSNHGNSPLPWNGEEQSSSLHLPDEVPSGGFQSVTWVKKHYCIKTPCSGRSGRVFLLVAGHPPSHFCVNLFISLYSFFLGLEWCFTTPMFLHMCVLWFRNYFLQFHVPTETRHCSLTSPSPPLWKELERRTGGAKGKNHGLR